MAFLYVKLVPELNYASRFYAKLLKQLKIYPAMLDDAGKIERITEGPPVQLLNRIQDPGGGMSGILGSYGRLMFIVGDGVLFGRDLDEDTETWAFLAKDEVTETEDGGYLWKSTPESTGVKYTPEQAVGYRMWTPDPEHSGEPESPMRAILEVAEELLLLTKTVRATAVTRIVNGILKVPSELSFGADEAGTDDDPEQNPFLADLIDHIAGAIEDAGSAEAATPFMAEGAQEYLAALEWIKIHDPQTDYMEQGLRKEAIERLAHGLDFPSEYLMSLANVNHWSARTITHEMWRTHGAPVAEQFVDDVCESYLRPGLRELGYEDWKRVIVVYDDANVVTPVDRTDDADDAANHGNISNKGYRLMKGIDESLAPSEMETKMYLAVKLREPAFLEGTPYEIVAPQPAAMPPGPAPVDKNAPPADEGPPPPGKAGVSREESRASALNGAAYASLLRCREVAGARIRQALGRKGTWKIQPPELELLNGHKNAEVAAILGADTLERYELIALDLVKGGSESFVTIALEWGIDKTQAMALGQAIEVTAMRTLCTTGLPAFPSGFFAQIARASDVSSEIGEEGVVRRNNEALARLEQMLPISSIATLR